MDSELDKHIELQLAEFGAATVQMSDGRLLVLTGAMLKELLAKAEEKGSDRSAIFIQTPIETAVDVPEDWN